MQQYEMDYWQEQEDRNNKIDNDMYGRYISDSSSSDEDDEIDNERTHGSNGGLTDGYDSWKYGG
jgi:hypothetical protein